MIVKQEKITIKTVALDAKVSVSAVSKVLRNAYGVSDSLRKNVQESIDRLGYRPSMAARGMRGRTYSIGILLVGLENPFLNKVILGINSALGLRGYKSIIGVGRAETRLETPLIESMIDFKMDGIILVAPRLEGSTLARFARQTPIVTIAHHEQESMILDTVNSDDRLGARLAVQALIERGYSDIAMISLPKRSDHPSDVSIQREQGYADAMQTADLSRHQRVIRVKEDCEMDDPELNAVLTDPTRARALFCWSDLHGVPIVNRAKQLGLRVPEDVAIVGYDNSPVAALPLIDLTSIRQSALELGEVAARCVLSRLDGRSEPEHHLLAPELVVRGSI